MPDVVARLLDAPLDPSGDEGRSWLRRELLDPAYHRSDPFGEFVDWLMRTFQRGLGTASDAPPLTVAAALVVLLALVLGVIVLLGRTRRDRQGSAPRPVMLQGESVTAAELRARAERAMTEGRYGDAAVDAFRAVAVRQHEQGRLELTPGATAHDIAAVLVCVFPGQRQGIDDGARVFDEVHYGEHPAGSRQAAGVLALDDELARS